MSTGLSPEEVAKLCFDKFKNLPKTGKPNNKEWTILAGVILHDNQNGSNQVISLGCGTKCIGRSKLCPQGLIINDSHAEVMARRGLLRYIYYQLSKTANGGESIFKWDPEKHKFQLNDGFSLHFLSTQTPCGDACIVQSNKIEERIEEPKIKKSKMEEVKMYTYVGPIINSVYTGAKLVGSHHTDAMDQLIGAVRTKPGRGERTLSMSCSDKLAKWQIMGVQGALLDYFLAKPIYFATLSFWGENNIVSLERAIWKRFESNTYTNVKYELHIPQIRICNIPEFPHAQVETKTPSPNALVWCNIPDNMKPYGISVNGKRQGITTKKLQTSNAALKISKFFLLKEFFNVLNLKPELSSQLKSLESKTYVDCKFLSADYQNTWSDIKKNYFRQWSLKPDNLLNFSVKEVENNTT